ncbi:MAG: hypothetical protein WC468_00315 [Candidatus Paceibacterota bacterium]
MSEEIVLKKFNKLSELVGKVMAIIIMWEELSQSIKDDLEVMTLFDAYQGAMPGLREPISQEILKRKDIDFKDLEMMHMNVTGDKQFLSELRILMGAAANSFKEHKGMDQKNIGPSLSKMIESASTTEDRLYILSKVEEGMAKEVFDKTISDINSGNILPVDFVKVCRYAVEGKGAYSKELEAFIGNLNWPFQKWKDCLWEAHFFEPVLVFILGKMCPIATTFEERWTVYDSYNDFSLRNPKRDEMICDLIRVIRKKIHLSKLFGETMLRNHQVAVIGQINKKKMNPFSWELSVFLDSCRKNNNDILGDFIEEIMAEQASGFEEWKKFLDKSRKHKKEYVLQRLSQEAKSAQEWLYVYDQSRYHDYPEMADKAMIELRKISASI